MYWFGKMVADWISAFKQWMDRRKSRPFLCVLGYLVLFYGGAFGITRFVESDMKSEAFGIAITAYLILVLALIPFLIAALLAAHKLLKTYLGFQ